MKKIIFALLLIGGISFIIAYYLTQPLRDWTQYGQNNVRSIVLIFVTLVVVPRPLAYIICGITELLFPNKNPRLL
jgi:uncharacterized membrane protein SpoIIM required for sporulation